MKRPKLKHHYHDARIASVQYRDETDVVITFSLCGCCNPTPGATATLIFTGVRNFQDVKNAFAERSAAQSVNEIAGIVREISGYIVALSGGAVCIDSRGLIEA